MKKLLLITSIILLAGCTGYEPDIGLEVPYHNRGCSGMDTTNSIVTVDSGGLNIISNIISDNPCYILNKAEINRREDNVTVFFTFSPDSESTCEQCVGLQSLVYKITGEGLNQSGITVNVIAYLGNNEVAHSFTS
ncbi:MAG: hypothetical protein WC307_05775 [Candidatus Nanoarchaeia archaeon]|jgi:hypothetical protein